MRILFVLENYHPHIGGVEIVFKNLCEGLAAKGHQVTVVTRALPGTKERERINGVQVIRAPCKNRYRFSFSPIVAHVVRNEAKHADLIHTTTFNAALPAWRAAKRWKKPSIITVHETWIGKWTEYTNFSLPKAYLHELLERMVFLPKFDLYACISKSTTARLKEVLPKQQERIITIYNGFDPAPWKKKQMTGKLRQKHGLGKEFVILGYGRPGTSKGFDYLVDAFPQIKRKIPNAKLLLILSNDAQYPREIARMQHRAHPDVLFLGPKPYRELPGYVQMADCVVIPSLTEGFGYTTIEAASSGTPVVASNTTSIPEVIYGKHILVEPKSSASIAEGVIAVSRGKYQVTPAKAFPWSKTVAAYERAYRRLKG